MALLFQRRQCFHQPPRLARREQPRTLRNSSCYPTRILAMMDLTKKVEGTSTRNSPASKTPLLGVMLRDWARPIVIDCLE